MIKIQYYLNSHCRDVKCSKHVGDLSYQARFDIYDGDAYFELEDGDVAVLSIDGTEYPCVVMTDFILCNYAPRYVTLSEDWHIKLSRDGYNYIIDGVNKISSLPIPIEY